MALQYVAISPVSTGSPWTTNVTALTGDTIAQADVGSKGCYLVVINGGASPDTVSIADPGFSPAGNAGAALTNAVANGTTEVMYISPNLVNASNVVPVTHSFITTVTCVVLRLG